MQDTALLLDGHGSNYCGLEMKIEHALVTH